MKKASYIHILFLVVIFLAQYFVAPYYQFNQNKEKQKVSQEEKSSANTNGEEETPTTVLKAHEPTLISQLHVGLLNPTLYHCLFEYVFTPHNIAYFPPKEKLPLSFFYQKIATKLIAINAP